MARIVEFDAKRGRGDDAVVGRVLLRFFRNLALAVGLPPLGAEVVRRVDVALVEEDRDLGPLLGHREEPAVLEAAAGGAERPGPRAVRLDHPGDAHTHAPEPIGVAAVGDVADVHPEEPGVAGLDVVVEGREHGAPAERGGPPE